MTFAQVIQFIIALPKVWQIWKQICQAVQQHNEQKHDNALQDLKNSKTDEEQKNATHDLAGNP